MLEQLDRTLDRGLAQILIARIAALSALDADTDAANAAKTFLRILGPVSNRAIASIDADLAATISPLWAGELDATALETITGGLSSTFSCD